MRTAIPAASPSIDERGGEAGRAERDLPRVRTWSDLIAALERGDADVVPVVSVTRAREARMLFTRPLVTSPASLFVRQDADDVRGWADLAGRRVAV